MSVKSVHGNLNMLALSWFTHNCEQLQHFQILNNIKYINAKFMKIYVTDKKDRSQ